MSEAEKEKMRAYKRAYNKLWMRNKRKVAKLKVTDKVVKDDELAKLLKEIEETREKYGF